MPKSVTAATQGHEAVAFLQRSVKADYVLGKGAALATTLHKELSPTKLTTFTSEIF